MRILLIEDEIAVSGFMAKVLEREGYLVVVAGEGGAGLSLALATDYDLIILDLYLPDMDGLDVLRSLRSAGRATRILLLSARSGLEDRIKGLELGADDYLPKPFDLGELVAHVKALLRRTPLDMSASLLRFEDLELDTKTKYVTRSGRAIRLPAKQYAILEYLMRHPKDVVSRQDLAKNIWASDPVATNNVIDVTVHLLRESLGKDFPNSLIQTVRGVGYRIGSQDPTLSPTP